MLSLIRRLSSVLFQLAVYTYGILSSPSLYAQSISTAPLNNGQQWIIHLTDHTLYESKIELQQAYPELEVQYQMFHGAWVVTTDTHFDMTSLSKDSAIRLIEPDLLLQPLLVPNDSRYNQQWAHFEVAGGTNIQEAHNYSLGENTTIAILDTGYVVHPDLNTNRMMGADMVTDAANARDGDGRDHNAIDEGDYSEVADCPTSPLPSRSSWHGSHVAGISSAIMDNGLGVVGVAPRSQHMHLRVLARCGGRISDIADGIAWTAGLPIKGLGTNNRPVDVINMSLGGSGTCSSSLQSAINFAVSRGITVVVAAGNDDRDAQLSTPANCDNVITVAATGRDGGKASYSNFGPLIDIAAPGGGNGGSILSTIDSGQQGRSGATYEGYNGTSMAAPHVAGVVALLKSVKPDLSPADIVTLLKQTARPFNARCDQCGAGIIDPTAALHAINAPLRNYTQAQTSGRYQYGGERHTPIADARSFFRTTLLNGVTTVSQSNIPAGRNVIIDVHIRHNALNQLTVSITPPGGTRQPIAMMKRRGNLAIYRFEINQSSAGDYDLRVIDNQGGGRGHITQWNIFQDEDR